MVALAKAYQDTDSSHSRTSRLRIIFRLRRNDHFWRKAASRSIRLLHQVKMAADYRSELDAAEAAKGQPSAAPTASGDGAPTVDAAEARLQIGGRDATAPAPSSTDKQEPTTD
jgi:hypothetical protein